MAQESLLDALEEDARAQADSIIQGAQARAAAMIAAAGEEASVMTDAMAAGARAAIGKRRAEVLNGARVRASSVLIDCRRALIDDVFKKALISFSSLERKEYGRVLDRWYDELCIAWEDAGLTEPPIVLINPVDAPLMEKKNACLRPDPLVECGIVFVSADASVRFENTFASRLEKAREDIMPVIERMLTSLQTGSMDVQRSR